jgi:hypothetical protein
VARGAGQQASLRQMAPARSTLAVLTVLAGLLSGCASAQPALLNTAGTGVTRAGAAAFAHAVNLRASDLPALEALGPEMPAPSPSATAFGFARCDGGVSPAQISVNQRSTLLTTPGDAGMGIRSRVTVMPSEALARENLAAFASRRGSRCELHYGGVSISSLKFALPGGAHAVGWRIVTPRKGKQPVGYHDLIAFLCGPAEVGLTAAGFSAPVPSRTERALIGVLYRRATRARSEL